MSSSRCVYSTASALNRVFITSIEISQPQFARHTSAISTITSRPKPLLTQQRRCYAAAIKAVGPGTIQGPPKLDRHPRNEEIKDRYIQLVDEENKLTEPRPTQSVLDFMDRGKFHLCVVQQNENGEPPICRLVSKRHLYQKEKNRKKSKSPSKTTKEVELNWALEPNDLAHKLAMMKGFLAKGHKVEITCAGRRRQGKTARQAELEEAEELIVKIRGAIDEVDGAKESLEMTGKLLGSAKIFAEGRPPKQEEVEEEEEDYVEEEIDSPARGKYQRKLEARARANGEKLAPMPVFTVAPSSQEPKEQQQPEPFAMPPRWQQERREQEERGSFATPSKWEQPQREQNQRGSFAMPSKWEQPRREHKQHKQRPQPGLASSLFGEGKREPAQRDSLFGLASLFDTINQQPATQRPAPSNFAQPKREQAAPMSPFGAASNSNWSKPDSAAQKPVFPGTDSKFIL